MNNFLAPAEIAEFTIGVGVKKSTLSIPKMLLLGFLAGAFIALAGQGSNIAVHNIAPVGIAKLIAGTLFPTGLILVIVAGAELFTGNTLIIMSCFAKKSKWSNFFKNLVFVYIGNLVGAVFVVWLVYSSGQFNYTGGELGGYAIKVAAGKASLPFDQAFFSGILCNWLVCLAVWMSFAAKDIGSKILAIFFPIWLFVLSGFEHCIANMFYIPAGLFASMNETYVNAAINTYNVSEASLSNLTLSGFFVNNLIPVTLGNLVGGVVFVGCLYYLAYCKKSSAQQPPKSVPSTVSEEAAATTEK